MAYHVWPSYTLIVWHIWPNFSYFFILVFYWHYLIYVRQVTSKNSNSKCVHLVNESVIHNWLTSDRKADLKSIGFGLDNRDFETKCINYLLNSRGTSVDCLHCLLCDLIIFKQESYNKISITEIAAKVQLFQPPFFQHFSFHSLTALYKYIITVGDSYTLV